MDYCASPMVRLPEIWLIRDFKLLIFLTLVKLFFDIIDGSHYGCEQCFIVCRWVAEF